MKITNLEIVKNDLMLAKPFAYFTATLEYLPYVLVKIEADRGLVGVGEGALAWDVTGENQEGAIGMKKYLLPIILGKEISCLGDILKLMGEINLSVNGNPALKWGIETALLDLFGQLNKVPIHKLFGKKLANKEVFAQKVIPYSSNLDEITAKVEKGIQSGAKIIKFKVGNDHDEELDIISNISQKYSNISIVMDVNQGWIEAKNALKKIKDYSNLKNIKWIEQPIMSRDYDGLVYLKKYSPIPIMADESCHNLFDLKMLEKYQAVDLINIKLAKTGGMIEALKMIDFCENHGIGYMLGDMIHSYVGVASSLHLAALGKFISFDLTPDTQVVGQKFEPVKNVGQKFTIPTKPGLGVKEIK